MTATYIPGATNEIQNPSFVSGYTYWSPTNATLAYQTGDAWAGTTFGQLTVSSIAGYAILNTSADSNKRISMIAGQTISGSIMVRSNQANQICRLSVTYWSSGGSNLTTHQGPWTVLTQGTWIRVLIQDISEAPATTAWAVISLEFPNAIITGFGNTPNQVGHTFDVDGADARLAAEISTYVDGDQGSSYGWFGTAHQSKSYRNAIQQQETGGRDGRILVEPRLYLATKSNQLLADISEQIISGFVEARADRAIKTQFRAEFLNQPEVEPYVDYLAPFLKITYGDGTVENEQLGLYSVSPGAFQITEGYRTGSYTGFDLTWELAQAAFSGRYTVAAGTNYVTAITTILTGAGFTRYAIPATSQTLPTARTWAYEASKLEVINDLLAECGYHSLYANRQGILTSVPYRNLLTTQPSLTLTSGAGSTVVGAIRQEPVTDALYNNVKIIREDSANAANSFVVDLTNSNPESPVSTVRLGRTISLVIQDSAIASQTVATSLAEQILQRAAYQYTNYQIQTLPLPAREFWEVYDTNIQMKDGTTALSGKLYADGWEIGFTPDTVLMTHYCHRLEAY